MFYKRMTKAQKVRSIFSWCLYDWANSAFGTVIITFVYGVYFARSVVGDETLGSSYWSYAISISGLMIAVLAPIMGSIADRYGARKKWLAAMTGLCVALTSLLFFGEPESAAFEIIALLAVVVLANTALELCIVFYNSMLPALAPRGMIGRVSGWAWGLGYFGGLFCLASVLLGLVGMGDFAPVFGITEENALNVRASALLTAAWFALFSLPLFLFTQSEGRTGLSVRRSIGEGLSNLAQTLKTVRRRKNFMLFLISSALYRDGLATVFAMGGLYAADVYDMDFQEILIFAIALNVSAGLGAFGFSFMDDKAGSKKTVVIGILGLIVTGVLILLAPNKTLFMVCAVILGIFVGPVQAASRTFAGRLSAEKDVAQTYGLYAFTGKSIAFLGPLAYGAATQVFGFQQAGMITILLFWIAGLLLLLKVREVPSHHNGLNN